MGYKDVSWDDAYSSAGAQDDWSLIGLFQNQSPIMKLWFLIMFANLVLVLLLI